MKQSIGIVEGFFSRPLLCWTMKERLRTIQFLATYCPRVNTYWYCPKDDQYVTKNWDKLYPIRQTKELANFVSQCKNRGIRCVYGLNPQISTQNYSQNFKKLQRKITQLESIGFKSFCILFDDIPLAYDVADQCVNDEEREAARLQSRIMNDLLKHSKNRWDQLFVCLSDYTFQRKSLFMSVVQQTLDKKTSVVWTGDAVYTKQVTDKMLYRARSIVGRDRSIILWNNYPVNDCECAVGTFHTGAYNPPSNVVMEKLQGVLINPMREAAANWPFYITLQAYFDSPISYSRSRALSNAFKTFTKDTNVAKSAYRIYESFGDENAIDSQPRGYMRRILTAQSRKDAQKIVSQTEKDIGRLRRYTGTEELDDLQEFLLTTVPTITRAERIIAIVQSILAKDTDNLSRLLAVSRWIPVALKSTYAQNTLRFVRAMMTNAAAFGGQPQTIQDELSRFETQVQSVTGRDRLTVTPDEEALMLSRVKKILRLEQEWVIREIRNGKIPTLKLIRLLVIRERISHVRNDLKI